MARLTAVLLGAVLVLPVLVASPAAAAPVTWYRTGATVSPGYRALATSPGTSSFVTSIDHGARTGSFLFHPGSAGVLDERSPGQSAGGHGYATTTALSGTVPGGTWTFSATVRTDVPAGVADGRIGVVVYAVGGGSSRLLGYGGGGSSTNVLAGPGDTTVTLEIGMGEVTLSNERIVTEWYLLIDRSGSAAAGSTTALRHGATGDTVTIPGPLAAPALGPPGTLTVEGVGDNRVSLRWEPSSDSRVTAYELRRAAGPSGPWTPVQTVTGTSAADTGLPNGTRVYHSVVAIAGDGARSTSSNATSAVPSDTDSPAAPTSTTVTPAGSNRLTVSWAPSPDGDVVGYEILRSGSSSGPFSRVEGPVPGTSFTNAGLPAASTWYYRIVAVDDDGLRSAPTPQVAGTVAPDPPGGLRVVAVADGAVALEWNPVAGAAQYVVERASGGSWLAVGRPSGTSFTDGGLTNGTTYTYRVRAIDTAGAASSPSASVSATPQDTGAPAPPTGLVASPRGVNGVRLTWSPSASASTVGYHVLRAREDGPFAQVAGPVNRTFWDDSRLEVGVPYRYQVVAVDASGVRSIPASVTYTVAPSAPGNLRLVAVNETTAQITWDATNDPRAGYRVLRSNDPSGPFTAVSPLLTTRTFTDGGLTLGRAYFYVVQAEAVDGTRSPLSNTLRVVPTNGPPTPPTGVVATDTGAGGEVSIVWAQNPESDIARYRVERSSGGAWTLLGTTPATTLFDRFAQNGVTYHYRVIAVDTVGFASDPSESATATPSDTQPPSAPSAPQVSQFGVDVRVVWSAVEGASGYDVLRSTDPEAGFVRVGSTGAGDRRITDSTVERGRTYYYRVQARDAAGNVSPQSAPTRFTVSARTTFGGGTGDGTTGGTTDGGAVDGGPGGSTGPSIPDIFGPIGQDGTVALGGGTAGGTTGTATDGSAADGTGGTTGAGTGASQGAADSSALDSIDVAGGINLPGTVGDVGRAAGQGLGGVIGRAAGEVAGNVGQVARSFRVPLVLLLLLAIYLVVQGRIDRGAVATASDVATGGEDDDVEYLL